MPNSVRAAGRAQGDDHVPTAGAGRDFDYFPPFPACDAPNFPFITVSAAIPGGVISFARIRASWCCDTHFLSSLCVSLSLCNLYVHDPRLVDVSLSTCNVTAAQGLERKQRSAELTSGCD